MAVNVDIHHESSFIGDREKYYIVYVMYRILQ